MIAIAFPAAARVARLGFLVVVLAAASARAAPGDACQPYRFEGLAFTVCSFDLRAHSVRLLWKDEAGHPYGGFGRLPDEVDGEPLVFATNGGMYRPDLSPAGLYAEGGETLRPANTADGPGNFHMKPNGVFFVAGERAAVMTTDRFLAERPEADYATQSGPMLVIDGRLHPRFLADGTSRKRRSGVCVRGGRTVVFALTEQPVIFHEFARLFRDALDCDNALFLDGTISGMHVPALGRSDLMPPVGPIIAVFARG